jgi:flagellar biosynthesis protein FliQ
MNIDAAYEIIKMALAQGLIVSAPFILGALIVGLVVSILQTITTIQEPTLSFLPKLLFAVAAAWIGAPWFLKLLTQLTAECFQKAADIVR